MLCLANAESPGANPCWLFGMRDNKAVREGGGGFAGAPSDTEIPSGQQYQVHAVNTAMSVQDVPQARARHHPEIRVRLGSESFPSPAAVFRIICCDSGHMLSIHQHLYAVSYNSHLLVFNECLFTGAFARECAWCTEPAHIPAASNTS